MKYYLVKTTYTATDENRHCPGKIQEFYSGKGGCTIAHLTVKGEPEWRDYGYSKWEVEEYGYKRRQDAARRRNIMQDSEQPGWRIAAEIVEVEM